MKRIISIIGVCVAAIVTCASWRGAFKDSYFAQPVVAAPAYDSYTKLMLHCDGADASTTFTDSSTNSRTVYPVADVQLDTANKKFGTASGLFDGTGDAITNEPSSDFSPGTGEFTIDFWMYIRTFVAYQQVADMKPQDATGVDYFSFGTAWATTTGKPFVIADGYYQFTGGVFARSNWYHVAIVGNGGDDGSRNVKVYTNGNIGITVTYNYNLTHKVMRIGSSIFSTGPALQQFFNGWLDEFRFSKGIQRWIADFTPPTAPY